MNRKSFLKILFTGLIATKLAIQCGARELVIPSKPEGSRITRGYFEDLVDLVTGMSDEEFNEIKSQGTRLFYLP